MTDEYHSDRILDWRSWLERMSRTTMQTSTRPRRMLLNPSPGRTRPGFSFSVARKVEELAIVRFRHKADISRRLAPVRFRDKADMHGREASTARGRWSGSRVSCVNSA